MNAQPLARKTGDGRRTSVKDAGNRQGLLKKTPPSGGIFARAAAVQDVPSTHLVHLPDALGVSKDMRRGHRIGRTAV